MRIINVCFYCCGPVCWLQTAIISFQVFEGGDIKKIQDLARNSDDPFYALEYYYDGKLTTSRY